MKKHLLLWFNGLGTAYEAAAIAATSGARILELFPFASRAHLLLEFPDSVDLDNWSSKLPLAPEHKQAFLNIPDSVLNAYLSLTSPPLREDLVIYEDAFLGHTLQKAIDAVQCGLEILDLRFMRDTTGNSYVMLTGDSKMCGEFTKSSSGGKIKHVKNPGEALREFFPQPL